jgi:thioredoxin 1
MKAVTKNTFKQDVLDSKKTVLIDVWAPWCAPCRGMNPIIEMVAEETKAWAEVVKIDASTEMDITQELGVTALPTFMVYKDGKLVKTSVGGTSKGNLIALMS